MLKIFFKLFNLFFKLFFFRLEKKIRLKLQKNYFIFFFKFFTYTYNLLSKMLDFVRKKFENCFFLFLEKISVNYFNIDSTKT